MSPRETSRSALIEQGTQLMLRSGYSSTGLIELLQAANVPKGSFYNHFGSKEEFAVEVVRRYYARHDWLLAELLAEEEPSPLERLRSYFDVLVLAATTSSEQARGCLLGMLAMEMAGNSEPLRKIVSEAFRRWEARIAELLRQAQNAGQIAPGRDPDLLAGALLQGWEGALMRARVSRDVGGLRKFLDFEFSRLLSPQ